MNRLTALLLTLLAVLHADDDRAGAPRAPRTQLFVAAVEQDPPLDRSSFTATLDGNPAKVLRVQGPSDDLILLLVLDLSGDPALIDSARSVIEEQLARLPANHWVSVLRAQDRLQVLVDPTGDRSAAIQAVQNYAATGKAGLLDTVEPVSVLGQRLMQRSGVRVAVIYISDSNIANYREDYTNPVINSSDSRDLSRKFPDQLVKEKIQKISGKLARFETPIFVVQLSYFGDPINEAYQRGLLQLAEESGGSGLFCRSRGDIPQAIQQIVDRASRHWSVAVELKNPRQRAVSIDLFNGDRDIPNRTRFALGK